MLGCRWLCHPKIITARCRGDAQGEAGKGGVLWSCRERWDWKRWRDELYLGDSVIGHVTGWR